MANKKTFAGGETVLECEKKTKEGTVKFKVTPDNFACVKFKGVKVSGEAYYVDKAVKLGATK